MFQGVGQCLGFSGAGFSVCFSLVGLEFLVDGLGYRVIAVPSKRPTGLQGFLRGLLGFGFLQCLAMRLRARALGFPNKGAE